ncbi:DNA mismatch repair protein PMS1 isoform X2 [Oryza brachyantha]|uniref:DNA mismatch repair protein S5 domain-containing protein n=1 Tax=Oryza brachyantha TaxID=4533 RepID=J3LEC6_ORYBR|nr:DNA mismatch repair protein PMS1 isoform X2 [Oryza brachyantha]
MGGGSSPAIRPIGRSAVHRICSGQVIFDLSSAVKELVENSLDAGATTVEVTLRGYGEDSFTVSDNGTGIAPSNFQALALKHHTSKISDFGDLSSVATFGFRGEALSSLCALGKLTVETRTKDEQVGTRLEFAHSGLVTGESKMARPVGTAVTVEKLFSTLPVRSKEFRRNIRKEYGKVISLLNAYALISKGVRLVCTNTTGKNSKMAVLRTQGSSSLKDNIITVFGSNTFKCLQPFNVTISEGCQVDGFLSKPGPGSGRNSGDRQFFYVNGRPVDVPKVSKLVNELYRSSNAKQYPVAVLNFCIPTTSYDVNVAPDKRKIFFSSEQTILLSLREGIENMYCPQQCSFSINNIEDPEKEMDPAIGGSDENMCLIEKENVSATENDDHMDETDSDDEVAPENQKVTSSVTETVATGSKPRDVSPLPRGPPAQVDRSAWLSAYRHKQPEKMPTQVKGYLTRANQVRTGLATKSSPSSTVQPSIMNFLSQNKRKHEDSCNLISEAPVLRRETCLEQVRRTELGANAPDTLTSSISNIVNTPQGTNPLRHHSPQSFVPETTEDSPQYLEPPNIFSRTDEVPHLHPSDVHTTESEADKQHDRRHSKCGSPGRCSEVEPQNELTIISVHDAHPDGHGNAIHSGSLSFPVMKFTLADLRRRRKHSFMISHTNKGCFPEKTTRCYKAATLDNNVPDNEEGKSKSLAAATSELDRFFSKDDFGEMEVVGQFNLGFIIGKLDHDLFIVDQHAADEKYNFENLSQSTTLNIQPLLQPLRLELSPEEEVIVSMNMSTIRKNGFVLAEDVHASPCNRFFIKAVPFSKNITFGAQDVKELISMLADSQGDCSIISSYKLDRTDSICPSRVRAMLASRACRMSTMIGDPLTKAEMKKILKNLTGLRSPWNCPHGRPTMRHLADLRTIKNEGWKATFS